MILARAQAQANQRARIGNGLALPSVIGLVTPHRFFAGLVPCPGGLAAQIVLPDQGFLNGLRAFGIDLLLPPQASCEIACRSSCSKISLPQWNCSKTNGAYGTKWKPFSSWVSIFRMQSLVESCGGCRRHQCATQRQRANGAELCVTKSCSRTNHPSNSPQKKKPKPLWNRHCHHL